MGPSASPTGRIGWAVIAPKVWPSRQRKMRRPKTLGKRRAVEKSKNRLFPRAWKSRQQRGISTFPQRRRLRYMSKSKNQNRTFHLLQKADILTCYEQQGFERAWRGRLANPDITFELLDATGFDGKCRCCGEN